MTELSFLIDLLLNKKLSKEVKSLIADRINLIQAQPPQGVRAGIVAQAPSTIANLEAAVAPTQISAASRIVGGMVNTGEGLKGPRKF